MELVIVTGMSGAGKSTVMNMFEDHGYYCVDNMPPQMISKFADICLHSDNTYNQFAIATDIRGGSLFNELVPQLELLEQNKISFKLLFLDCVNAELIKRYKETRRKHPLIENSKSIEQALIKERSILAELREKADFLIDTTYLKTIDLKSQISKIFLNNNNNSMYITVSSFGFKHGENTEADLLFDVRCLTNPFYVEQLKPKTGLDKEVSDYVMSFDDAQKLLKKLIDLIDFLIPLYKKEGKSYLVIALGCTGGKHRSITFAELIFKHLKEKGENVSINHRDILK